MPGRNDPCTCGSGRKFKRCCQPSVALLDAAERMLGQLSDHCRHAHPATYRAGLNAFYDGAPQRFGMHGPTEEEARRAERWFLLDGVEPGEPAVLRCLSAEGGAAPVALERSGLRMLRLAPGGATCPLSGSAQRVLRSSSAEVDAGGLVVARCVPLDGEVVGLLSGACPVAEEVEHELLALARSSATGRELARAAVNWPEERLHTAEGEEVEDHTLAVDLLAFDSALTRLSTHPRLVVIPEDERDEPEVESWSLLPASPPQRGAPPALPGVRWQLDEEEGLDPPRLAGVQLDPFDGRLWVFAATRSRMETTERELRALLKGLLGDTPIRTVDSSRTPRWHRLRMDRLARAWDEPLGVLEAA